MAMFPKLKPSKASEAATDLRSFLDEKAYLEIDRAEPALITIISDLLKAGNEPTDIRRLVMQYAPQRWIEAKQIEQAARWIAAGMGK